jgi:NAD(P)-dependent dehydrogenase (short-subunit alcohol dehydrogenase family)
VIAPAAFPHYKRAMTDSIDDKRIALVTGASRGIGRAAALALAGAGHHVILSARTSGALEEVDDEIRQSGGSASILRLNLTQADKVDALGPTLFQRWQRLDVLVAAGGILGPLSPLPHLPDKDWDEVIGVNLTANWRLIRTLDPLLRRSDAGRALFITSRAASNIRAYWGAYAVSKAGLEALVKTYAAETASTPVKVNLLDPGPTRTKMRAQAYPGEDIATVKPPEALAPLILELTAIGCDRSGEVVSAEKAGSVEAEAI